MTYDEFQETPQSHDTYKVCEVLSGRHVHLFVAGLPFNRQLTVCRRAVFNTLPPLGKVRIMCPICLGKVIPNYGEPLQKRGFTS